MRVWTETAHPAFPRDTARIDMTPAEARQVAAHATKTDERWFDPFLTQCADDPTHKGTTREVCRIALRPRYAAVFRRIARRSGVVIEEARP